MDLARIEIALEELMGVRVDVQTPGSLHRNFRDRVVAEAVALQAKRHSVQGRSRVK